MAKPFDPRQILKRIANPLLGEFFTRRGELENVPFDTLTEHAVEPIFEAWQALEDAARLEVQVILRDVSALSDHRSVSVLVEEVRQRCPEQAAAFEAQRGRADKAMWVYLHAPDAFAEAAMFARADALATGRYWQKRSGLPKGDLILDEAMTDRLATALTEFYGPLQMRGRHCQVVHYARSDGSNYFFAYLDDYPDKHVVFDDAGRPIVRSDRYAFENVFVYTGDEGTMESYAPGGQKVRQPLEIAFCKAVLGEDVGPADPLRPSYRLDHLVETDYPLASDPRDRIAEARIVKLCLAPVGSGGSVQIKADVRGPVNDIYRKIDRWLRDEHLPAARTRVLRASFRLTFQHDGPGRAPTVTFDVAAPSSSNLKSKPDAKRMAGERCLKLWGVVADDG